MSDNDLDNDFNTLVIINENNTLHPYECSNDDLKVLNFQDTVIKYKKMLDEYKPYTEIIAYGFNTVKSIALFTKAIFL